MSHKSDIFGGLVEINFVLKLPLKIWVHIHNSFKLMTLNLLVLFCLKDEKKNKKIKKDEQTFRWTGIKKFNKDIKSTKETLF